MLLLEALRGCSSPSNIKNATGTVQINASPICRYSSGCKLLQRFSRTYRYEAKTCVPEYACRQSLSKRQTRDHTRIPSKGNGRSLHRCSKGTSLQTPMSDLQPPSLFPLFSSHLPDPYSRPRLSHRRLALFTRRSRFRRLHHSSSCHSPPSKRPSLNRSRAPACALHLHSPATCSSIDHAEGNFR